MPDSGAACDPVLADSNDRREGLRVARELVWPACTGAAIATLAFGYRSDLGPYVLPMLSAGLLCGITGLERVLPRDATRGFLNDPQKANDVGHLLVGGVVGETIGNAVVVAGAAVLGGLLPPVLGLWPAGLPIWAQVVMMLIVADGLEYGRHRTLHRVPWLFRAHALHHDVDRLHAINSSRNHALDLLSRAACVFAPLALIGVPPLWLPLYSGAILVVSPLSHSNLDLRIPRWLQPLILTPPVHAVHHARAASVSDSNFAAVSPLWDVLFGTFRWPEADASRPVEFGIEGEPWPSGFWAQLVAPFRRRPTGA